MRRTLALKKETLTELGPDDLRAVNGGFPTTTWILPEIPTYDVCTSNNTGLYLSIPLKGCLQ
ncbi:MAG: hypothetical protein QOE45_3283 [Frankiaceae bacterium]|jgi:hypothetical protein|nr:hypothetical protein [Frankiaceae bacterium]